MKRKTVFTMIILALTLLLVACGGDGEEPATSSNAAAPRGNAENGEKLFKQTTIGSASAPGCTTCHSLEPDTVLVGPSQAGLATRAGTRVDGQSAEEYIKESISNPNAYIVDGFVEGVMYQNYGSELTAQEIDDIVAYTLTLK